MGWLRDVYGLNPAIKLLIDPASGRILDANDAAAAFYGYSVEELCALQIQQINTLGVDEVEAEMERARAGNRAFFRFRHRLRSGEQRDVEVYTGPVLVEGATCLLSIIHDVTDRERALEEHARSEARQRALLRALPVGVALHRYEKLIWANEGLAQIVGRTTEEMVGAQLAEILPAETSAATLERMRRTAAAGGSAPVVRGQLLHAEGRVVAVDLFELPFDADSDPCRMLLVMDVSDRARLEEDLHRAQRMDAIGRVAGGVAHDFNNLLFVVLGAADALARRPTSIEHFDRNVDRIREAAQRASELTRQLLLVSRGHEAKGERIELSDAVRDLLQLVSGTLPERLDVQVDVLSGLAVLLPRSSFDQILLNLVVNARDAMPSGGTMRVTGTEIEHVGAHDQPAGLAPGWYVLLEVSDTGTGMPSDVMAKAFEPFFTTKEPGKGTGLGLSTAYGIVRRAGGAIEIESEPLQGTTVRIFLPRATEAATIRTPPPPSREVPLSGRTRTVLLVDDQRAIRELIELALSERGYRVLSAAGAAEALLIAEQQATSIDLLLTDVVMPKMRGPELARRILALRPGLPVLFMSGYTGDALADTGIDPGLLLEKPFGTDLLVTRVEELLVQARTLKSAER